jgi:aspartate kinase
MLILILIKFTKMKVYKFGGASVKDASGIRNLAKILSSETSDLVIVISAFGKTTNSLERVLKAWKDGDSNYMQFLEEIYKGHIDIIEHLSFEESGTRSKIDVSFACLREYLLTSAREEYDFEYDQIVSFGEIWSTIIVEGFLKSQGLKTEWIDIREILLTDDRFRDANILWGESTMRIKRAINFSKSKFYVTQGFIAGTISGRSTTLGREGSDYTAAIIANILDAEYAVFWKDVPGILNADPKWRADAVILHEISYKEAVEMTFSGAKIIHPKTIKPLHNKNIPLYVKSFIHPAESGTIVKADVIAEKIIPIYIKKENQILISILPKDFSFVMGENLSRVFHAFMVNGIKVNLVQASAVSIDVCVDDDRIKVDTLIDDLGQEFKTIYNDKAEMLSIRHYDPGSIANIIRGYEILLEQKTRRIVRFVVKKQSTASN